MTFGIYLLLNSVLLLLLAVWIRRVIVRRLQPERIMSDLSTEIGELITELNQTGDHNVSVIEDRIMQLRDLVADADRQIDELSILVRRMESSESAEEPVYTVSFSGAAVSSDSSEEDSVEESGSRLESTAAYPEEKQTRVLSPRDQVRELHQQGLSSEIIAGKTGIAIGEVELIISLGSGRSER